MSSSNDLAAISSAAAASSSADASSFSSTAPAPAPGPAPAPTSAFDRLMIQSLMSRLQLRPPHLDTNSFLSQNLDDFLLHDADDDDDSASDDSDPNTTTVDGGDPNHNRKLIAKEEAKLEKELIRIINSGNGHQTLKPNSGQSVSIGDHNICVGVHDEKGSEYRVWEWHGHIMFFDEEDGYSAEYIYGNYFERVVHKKESKSSDEEGSKVKGEGNSGLRDLIGGEKDGVAASRVVHRNSINAAVGLAATAAEAK